MRFVFAVSIFLFFLSVSQNVKSQTTSSSDTMGWKQNIVFRAEFFYGEMLKIYPSSPHVNPGTFTGIGAFWQTDGSKPWHKTYGFPEIGINFFYNNLGNKTLLGHSVGIVPNVIFRMRRDKRWGGLLNLSSGFAFYNKTYNKISNPNNLIIGSKITDMTYLATGIFVKVTPNIDVEAGKSTLHFSDGHVRVPNVGYNDFPWFVAIRYKPFKNTVYKTIANHDTSSSLRFNVRFGLGFQDGGATTTPTGGPIYHIYEIAPYVSKRLNSIWNLRLGLNAAYYVNYYEFMKSEQVFTAHEQTYSWVCSATFGNEWTMGRFGFLIEPAIKFYNPFFQKEYVDQCTSLHSRWEQKRWISARAGFSYCLLKDASHTRLNPVIGMYIKTNKTQADYVVISLSVGF